MCGDVTAGLLDIIHDIGLVHHIPLAKGHKLLQLVRQQLSSDIYPVQT